MPVRPVSLRVNHRGSRYQKGNRYLTKRISFYPLCTCVNVYVRTLSLSLPPTPPNPPRVSHILYMIHKTLTFLPDVSCVPQIHVIPIQNRIYWCLPVFSTGILRGFVNTSKLKTAHLVDRYTTSSPCGHSVLTMTNTTDCIHRVTEFQIQISCPQ